PGDDPGIAEPARPAALHPAGVAPGGVRRRLQRRLSLRAERRLHEGDAHPALGRSRYRGSPAGASTAASSFVAVPFRCAPCEPSSHEGADSPRARRRQARRTSSTIGRTEIKTIATMTDSKWSFTNSKSAKKRPAKTQISTQAAPPTTLYAKKRRYRILPMPATNGANVRTIGTNRARMIALPPYLS